MNEDVEAMGTGSWEQSQSGSYFCCQGRYLHRHYHPHKAMIAISRPGPRGSTCPGVKRPGAKRTYTLQFAPMDTLRGEGNEFGQKLHWQLVLVLIQWVDGVRGRRDFLGMQWNLLYEAWDSGVQAHVRAHYKFVNNSTSTGLPPSFLGPVRIALFFRPIQDICCDSLCWHPTVHSA